MKPIRHRLAAVVITALLSGHSASAGQGDGMPVLSTEHLDKLRKIAMSADLTATPLNETNARILGLGDTMQAKQMMGELPDGRYYIAFAVGPEADDILFAQRRPASNFVFLTNSSLTLRAAIIVDATGTRLITSEQAAEDYTRSLKTWDELAAALPVEP